jgi:hypothetical protein
MTAFSEHVQLWDFMVFHDFLVCLELYMHVIF